MSGPGLPALAELLADLRVVRLPLHMRFRGVEHRELAMLRGPAGWAEFGPFLEYQPAEAARWLAAAIETAWQPWPQPVRERIEVNATVPAVPAAEVESVLRRYDGCRTAKIKVAEPGQQLAHDVARVWEVRRLMGPTAALRVDANGGWSVPEALEAITRLAPAGLEYAEQPVAEVESLRTLRLELARRHVDVPIAADESIRRAADPLVVARRQAADIIVVKVAPLGGVRAALQIVAECALPAVVSSALDSSIGIQAGVALAAALPQLDHACGLSTLGLFAADVVADSLLPQAGSLPVDPQRRAPDPALLSEYRVSAERHQWWRERVTACHQVLTG